MKKLFSLIAVLSLWPLRPAAAWNPVSDLRDNVVWTFGKQAEAGQAIKISGAGDLKSGETATSLLAGIADYRFLSLSYGGTRVNKAAENFTDTAKIGLRVTDFLGWFKNPPTPEMAFLKNLNVGPSFSMPLFSSPHAGTVFVDVNYTFGNAH